MALQDMSKNNVVAKGLESNRIKITAACKRGLDVGYFDLESHKEQYDSISLLNVYSHLTNPPELLRLIRQRLTPGGELLLETGDSANLPAHPFLLPDHLSFTSEQILSDMLSKAGFDIISVSKYPSLKLRFMKTRVLIETVKLLLPFKRSQLAGLYDEFKVSKRQTDLWIRARACA